MKTNNEKISKGQKEMEDTATWRVSEGAKEAETSGNVLEVMGTAVNKKRIWTFNYFFSFCFIVTLKFFRSNNSKY